MSFKTKAAAKQSLMVLGMMMAMTLLFFGITAPAAHAADNNTDKAVRTIMYYECGCDPETTAGAATANLVEAMNAKFDNERTRFIVMTGGADKWQMKSEYLRDQNGNEIEEGISNEYNQIWELTGATDEGHGHMTLLKGDGVTGKKSVDELMNDPATLTAFINWVYGRYPADHNNLMFWDHGHGPAYGYGIDEHKKDEQGNTIQRKMPVADIVGGISNSNVIKDPQAGKFDIIEFDCCMMGNFEIALALQDYTDYYLGCPDIDPFASLDYTALLDYLGENPGVDSKTLGRKTVDIYVDWFNDHPDESSTNRAVTLCMVDTQQLKRSGIVGHMQTLAKILRQKAVQKSFYDEIRSTKDDFQYAYPALQSLETLVEQLGINLYELESIDNPTLSNDYTKTAKAIRAILSNKDVIYARSTNYSEIDKAVIGRSLEDGNVEIREPVVPLSGLTSFFVVNRYYDEFTSYDQSMQDLVGVLNDDDVKNFISTYRKAVIDYKLILEAGAAVSAIVESGEPAEDVDFEKVKAYWNSQTTLEQENLWDKMSPLIASRGDGTDAWLEEIINIQKKEVIDHDKVSIWNEKAGKEEYYHLNIKDTPKPLIDVPVLLLSATLADPPEGIFTNEVNMVYEGEQIFDDPDIESFLDLIAGKTSSYRVPRFDGEWYAVEDANGTKYVASIESENSVYAQFVFKNDSPDASPKNGLLVFDKNGNAKSIVVEDKPIDIDSIIGSVTAELMNSPKTLMPVPISLSFDPKKAKLIKAPISELGIEVVEAKMSICDIYDAEHDITDLMKQADESSITGATVSGIKSKTWTGKALKQSLVVKLSGKTLKNGADYTVTYKNNKNVGKAALTITGKGDYSGTITEHFKINPKGTSIAKLTKAKKAVTVKWKKQSAKMSKSRITGYQIQLATNKGFTKNKKTVTVKGYKTVSRKVRGLKGSKKYYVKIRTYKTVNGAKFYSSWSKIKTVKTK